MLRFRISHY